MRGKPRAATAGDRWSVCPGQDIEECALRAQALLRRGDDLHRAARLAYYAAYWGAEGAQPLTWEIDLARGIPADEVLARAVTFCPVEGGEGRESRLDNEHCEAVSALLARFLPSDLERAEQSAWGNVAREACLREREGSSARRGWCELLSESTLCDLDGCG